MIHFHEKFMFGEGGSTQFFAEVNWHPKDKNTNECKVVRFTFPDGKQTLVKREHLHSMLFAIGRPEDQAKLVPSKLETIRNLETVLGIKATKNIEKGEMINVRVKIPIPLTTDEVIGEAPKSSSIIKS